LIFFYTVRRVEDNISIYFLLFVQSLFLFKKVRHNRFIYLNIAIFTLFHSLSFASIFIGESFLIKNNYLSYYFFEYEHILLSALPAVCIIYIAMKYLFEGYENWKIYAMTFAIVLPVFFWHFHPYLLDKRYILTTSDTFLDRSVLFFDFLPLFFLILYGVLLYKFDRSLGEHVNTIMVCFFILTIMDVNNLIGYIYDITIFQYTQFVLMVTLSFFLITMIRLLNYAYSEFGHFYDSLVVSGNDFGVPIKRKETKTLSVLDFGKAYFHQRRHALGFTTFVFVFAINYFNVSPFIKLNLAVIAFCILTLFFYMTALYHKRLNNGNLVNIKNEKLYFKQNLRRSIK